MPDPQGKSDRAAMLTRSRNPHRSTATEQVIPTGDRHLVSSIRVLGTTAGKATFRSGGAGGDIVWELQVPAGEDAWQDFPAGLLFEDGVHVTISAGDEVVYIAATDI